MTWKLTYGETYPYEWCVYVNDTPEKRFIRREDALHYLDEISKGSFLSEKEKP